MVDTGGEPETGNGGGVVLRLVVISGGGSLRCPCGDFDGPCGLVVLHGSERSDCGKTPSGRLLV